MQVLDADLLNLRPKDPSRQRMLLVLWDRELPESSTEDLLCCGADLLLSGVSPSRAYAVVAVEHAGSFIKRFRECVSACSAHLYIP